MPSEHTVGGSETLESCILSQLLSGMIRASYRPVLSSCVLLPPAVRRGHPSVGPVCFPMEEHKVALGFFLPVFS